MARVHAPITGLICAPTDRIELPLDGAKVVKAERMPLKEGKAEAVPIAGEEGALVEAGESPVYLWLER